MCCYMYDDVFGNVGLKLKNIWHCGFWVGGVFNEMRDRLKLCKKISDMCLLTFFI